MAAVNNDNAPSTGGGKSSVNTQEKTSTTNTNDKTSTSTSSGASSLDRPDNSSLKDSAKESLSNSKDSSLNNAREEISIEQEYFNSLAGQYGKTSQDSDIKALRESSGEDHEVTNDALKNAYKNYNERDLDNKDYEALNRDALRSWENDRNAALKAIQQMGHGLQAYNAFINDAFDIDKNITFRSEDKAQLFKDYRKNGAVMNTAKNLTKGDGFLDYMGESFGSKIDNVKHNVANTWDNIYTSFGGINKYGNTWSETHGGDKLADDASWADRVGSNMWQKLKNIGDSFDVAFGGANNQTGLNKYGMKADLDGDGKISLNERLDNIVTGLVVGNNATKYDLDLDGHLDKYETADALAGRLLGNLSGQSLIEESKKENKWGWQSGLQKGMGITLNALDIITNPFKAIAAGLGGIISTANNYARNNPNKTNKYMAGVVVDNSSTTSSSPQTENLTVKPKTTASNLKKEGWDDMIEESKAKLKEKLSKKKGGPVISDERLKTFVTNTWINDNTIKDLMIMNLLQNKVRRYI